MLFVSFLLIPAGSHSCLEVSAEIDDRNGSLLGSFYFAFSPAENRHDVDHVKSQGELWKVAKYQFIVRLVLLSLALSVSLGPEVKTEQLNVDDET